MKRIPGVVIGIVQDLEDPEGEGRIKLTFPWFTEEPKSAWATLAVPLAGPDRGAYIMPEIDDEALVAFDQGDFDHPFILGFLWNGKDKPPNQDINPSVRRLRTVSGHVLEFDDNSGEERILLTTQGEHEIELKDSPTASVTIKTSGGHEIVMDDAPPASVTVKTSGGQEIALNDLPASISVKTTAGNKVEISDVPPGITISAQTGMVTVQCLQASINASALMSVTAPLAQFAGVVQATTIMGAAYVPAPGNTFGL